jgi:type IV pilus assembly protein PilV
MRAHRMKQSGFLMLEVMIAVVVLALGLLGLAGLQARAHQAETESYTRVQALALLRDMADRINANRANAAGYITPISAPLGTGATKDCSAPTTTADVDLCAWSDALLGAGETQGGNNVGAMLGARGCITSIGTNIYLIEVAWQGLNETTSPVSALQCGKDDYGDERQRRDVSTVVEIGTLT